MEIVDNRGLLLRVRHPAQVLNVIPKAKRVGENEVLVRWGLEEAKVLHNIGIKNVPSPVLGRYKWTGFYPPYEHQKETSAFLTMHKRAFCLSEAGCVDSETEYLSPTGWVKISEYSGGAVAQYHPETGVAEFVTPTDFVKLPCDSMVRIKTKYGLDQLLSPEHRVLAADYGNPDYRETLPAIELLRRHDAHLSGYRRNARRRKDEPPYVGFSKLTIPTAFHIAAKGRLPLSDGELRLQIAANADGYFGSNTNHVVIRIKKNRKKVRLRRLLEVTNTPYVESVPEYESAKGFSIFKFHAPLREKGFAAWWGASYEQLSVVTDEVLHWDGSVARGKRFSTSHKEDADFVQYAFSATGHTARVFRRDRAGRENRPDSVEYTVHITDRTHLGVCSRTPTVSTAPSTDGYKYCFMVPSTYLVFRRNGCVFLSGNTGKTASVIWAADYLLTEGFVQRVLIVCPKSIMKAAWMDDLFKFAIHRTAAIAHGTKAARIAAINSEAEFVIINYDGLHVVQKEIQQGGFDLVVADEATALKTVTTRRWKTFKSILQADTRLWLMTGTPAAQSPTDAYGLARLVNPEGVPRFFGAFRDQVMTKITQFKWVPRMNAEEIVHRALQPAIRYTKEQCLDLPPITYVNRDVEMTAQQQRYYDKMRADMRAVAAGAEITAVNAAARINKLLQIATGAVYSEDGDVVEFDAQGRLQVLEEIIQEAAHKVIVFVPFTHTIEQVHDYLSRVKVSNEIINGAVPMNRRNSIFERFQTQQEPRVLIIQPQAAAHGVTLTAADTVVWYAPTTSVELYMQGNARPHRAGQHNPCTVYHLQGSGVERRLNLLLRSNLGTHEKIMDLYNEVLDE